MKTYDRMRMHRALDAIMDRATARNVSDLYFSELGFRVGDKVTRDGDGPYKVLRINGNGSVEVQFIPQIGRRPDPSSILGFEKARRELKKI